MAIERGRARQTLFYSCVTVNATTPPGQVIDPEVGTQLGVHMKKEIRLLEMVSIPLPLNTRAHMVLETYWQNCSKQFNHTIDCEHNDQ